MGKFLYPVDTDQFECIIEDGKVYVDKTDIMFDLVRRYRYVFLARPRRFGKTLLCTTLKAYFEGKKELFVGLKIAELEKNWKTHPVLHFSMSGLKNLSIAEAKSKLGNYISDYEKIYGKELDTISLGARFRKLIHNAYKKTSEKAVVILDEYDSPIVRLLYDERLDGMRELLREFYQVLKDEGAYLRFVFITGVTKFSQLSIFSELNNLMQISLMDEYSGICGITSDELDIVLRPCVEEYATDIGVTVEEAYATLKKNYDGYHFSPNGKDVYAPFSLLRALNNKTTDNFWFESGTTTSLIEHLKHFPSFNPLEFDEIETSLESFNCPCENAKTPMPLLYQCGYLSISSYNKQLNSYTLGFPNYEVRQGMVKGLTNYLIDSNPLVQDNSILKMAKALNDGNLGAALVEIRSFIASLPYDIITKKEWVVNNSRESFYKMLMYIIFSLLNSKVETEVKSIIGRADVVIKTQNDIYVIELKLDDSVENALAQIDTKEYAVPYESDGRTITKCGVSISSEKRNIAHWRAIDGLGTIIDEQVF